MVQCLVKQLPKREFHEKNGMLCEGVVRFILNTSTLDWLFSLLKGKQVMLGTKIVFLTNVKEKLFKQL